MQINMSFIEWSPEQSGLITSLLPARDLSSLAKTCRKGRGLASLEIGLRINQFLAFIKTCEGLPRTNYFKLAERIVDRLKVVKVKVDENINQTEYTSSKYLATAYKLIYFFYDYVQTAFAPEEALIKNVNSENFYKHLEREPIFREQRIIHRAKQVFAEVNLFTDQQKEEVEVRLIATERPFAATFRSGLESDFIVFSYLSENGKQVKHIRISPSQIKSLTKLAYNSFFELNLTRNSADKAAFFPQIREPLLDIEQQLRLEILELHRLSLNESSQSKSSSSSYSSISRSQDSYLDSKGSSLTQHRSLRLSHSLKKIFKKSKSKGNSSEKLEKDL